MTAEMVTLFGVPSGAGVDTTPLVGRRFDDGKGAERVIVLVTKKVVWHAAVLADGSVGTMTSDQAAWVRERLGAGVAP